MRTSTYRVKKLVEDIRKRWRRRALVQGSALTLLTLVLGATLLLVLYVTVPMRPGVLLGFGVVVAVATLGVLVQFMLRPLMQHVSDQQIALFVEEKIPELEDRLNSAVEVDEAGRLNAEHSALLDKLIDDAARKTRTIPITTVVDQKRERMLTVAAGACLVLFLVFGFSMRNKVQFSDGGLHVAAAGVAQPFMTVQPGNVEIERGETQEVIVELREERGDEMTLVYKEGDGEWVKTPMQRGVGEEAAFLQEFLNIQAPIQYYVEYGDVRSDPYTISIYEFPAVAQIDVTYRYPDYTGLPPRTDEATGDIRGLKGSTVTLNVQTTGTAETAELVLDDDRIVALDPTGDGHFQGTLTLAEYDLYTVRLTDANDKQNKFPEEYEIVPVEDEKPYITITDPQRDVRANAIEEVLVATSVQDDFGVKDVRLRYSVNGDEEQTIALKDAAEQRPTETDGEHLFYLEDFGLQPGDVISYYVEAEDFFHEAPEMTDMYFIEVIPFDQEFRQANNMGGMQGQQQSALVLSQQEIIAATWRLLREQPDMDAADYAEARQALVQAQNNLKANIEQRINSTAFSLELRASEDQQKIVEYLRDAIAEMGKAVADLTADRLRPALTPERKALNHLLRADALNKENQVAMNRGQSGGQGGGTEERMTELMDLELDISKDKYEMQQQRAGQQQDQQVDEALQRIKDLARRQQNLANQSRSDELQGEDKKRFIDQLKRDQEEMRRQAEDLANSLRQQARGNEQLSRQSQEQMERVAENMRRAEQALQRGNEDEAMRRQQQALNQLDDLQRDLQRAATDNTREMAEDLAQKFDQLREQERQLGDDIERAARQARTGQGVDREALERLQEQRRQVMDDLRQMTDQAEAVEERVRPEDPEVANAIRDARRQMERDRLDEAMRQSEQALEHGWIDRAERLEEHIEQGLENLQTMREAFDNTLPAGEDEQLARALDELRDLRQQMEDLQQQAQQGQQDQQGTQQGGQSGNQQGRAEAARRQRELQRAQQSLERLQRSLGGSDNAGLQRSLREIQSNLARAENTGQLLTEDAAKEFFDERIFDPLSQLETEIAKRLDLVEMEKKLYGARPTDVPAEYRELVEKYYEALSKGEN